MHDPSSDSDSNHDDDDDEINRLASVTSKRFRSLRDILSDLIHCVMTDNCDSNEVSSTCFTYTLPEMKVNIVIETFDSGLYADMRHFVDVSATNAALVESYATSIPALGNYPFTAEQPLTVRARTDSRGRVTSENMASILHLVSQLRELFMESLV